jgi:hypothetical protein
MIMAEQHYIDARKVLKPHTGFAPPPRTDPGEWTRPFGPDRISQNVDAKLLQQNRGMVDKGNSEVTALDGVRRFRCLNIVNEARGSFPPAGEAPMQSIKEAGRHLTLRIVKALAVEVARKGRWGGTMHGSHYLRTISNTGGNCAIYLRQNCLT